MMSSRRNPSLTWRAPADDDDDLEVDPRLLQTYRDPRQLRQQQSLQRGDDGHVRDCLVWDFAPQFDGQRSSAERRRLAKERVRSWNCLVDNRCNDSFYRRMFCRQNHCKYPADGSSQTRRQPCLRSHCTHNPCDDEECAEKHCRDPDCPDRAGCQQPNCRTCRGLDARMFRDVGYVRRIELGRPKDRGEHWTVPKYGRKASSNRNDGSAAEAITGWPKIPSRKPGQLEPLENKDQHKEIKELKRTDYGSVLENGLDLWRYTQDDVKSTSYGQNADDQSFLKQNGNDYKENESDFFANSDNTDLRTYRQTFPRVAERDPDYRQYYQSDNRHQATGHTSTQHEVIY